MTFTAYDAASEEAKDIVLLASGLDDGKPDYIVLYIEGKIAPLEIDRLLAAALAQRLVNLGSLLPDPLFERLQYEVGGVREHRDGN